MLDLISELEEQGEIKTLVYESVENCTQHIIGNNKLNIIHLNIRSLNKNFNELLIYLEQFNVENIDIIVLSETWRVDSVSNFNISNFNLCYNESQNNQNDGLMVYL